MPTILREDGYRFFFFSLDWKEPLHVHVEYGDKYAKFWLKPVTLARSWGFRSHEITQIRKIVEENENFFESKWNEYFSDKNRTPRR